MSRTDLVGSGLTLLMGGVAYFVGGPIAATVAVVVGIALIVLAHLRKSEEDPEPGIGTALRSAPILPTRNEASGADDPCLVLIQERKKLESELEPLLKADGQYMGPMEHLTGTVRWRNTEDNIRSAKIGRMKRDIEAISARIRQQETGRPSGITHQNWTDLAKEFQQLPGRIRADWNRNGDGEESWRLPHAGCMALCKMAGAMLVRSPKVFAGLSEASRSETDTLARWLNFLKGEKHLSSIQYGIEHPGEKIHLIGSIDGVAELSSIVCTECAATEL